MRRIGIAVGCVLLAMSVTACKKDPCAEANFKPADPKICMKLPPGMKADPAVPENGGKQINFSGNGKYFNLFYTDSNHVKDVDGYIAQNTAGTNQDVIGKGAVPGSDAKFYFVKFKSSANYGAATVYYQGKTRFYECRVNTDYASMGPMVDACKSLWAE